MPIAESLKAFFDLIWSNWNSVTVFTGALVVVGTLQGYVYWRQARYMKKGLRFTAKPLTPPLRVLG